MNNLRIMQLNGLLKNAMRENAPRRRIAEIERQIAEEMQKVNERKEIVDMEKKKEETVTWQSIPRSLMGLPPIQNFTVYTDAGTLPGPYMKIPPPSQYYMVAPQSTYEIGKNKFSNSTDQAMMIEYNAETDGWLVKLQGNVGSSSVLQEAQEKITELTEILERVQKEPLILYSIDRISKNGKHAYVKKGDTDLRIESCKELVSGDEVLLHPKTYQIVERLGRPPLEASRFAPDSVPNVTWNDIGGLEDAKADFIEAIELPQTNKRLFAHYNKPPIKGILLAGPPGCGKTMLGKAAANSLARMYKKESVKTSFLYIKGPEILNCYVGESERTIRDIFFDAKRHKEEHGYPAVIFIDDADAILATRGSRNVGIGNTIVPTFLTEMDGLEESGAIVIIATNRPDVLDPAIVRDGRIDRKVLVTRPNEDNAGLILEMNLKKVPIAEGTNAKRLALGMLEHMYSSDCKIAGGVYLRDIINGAMLANCVQIAIAYAINRDMAADTITGLTMEDCTLAIHRIQKQCAGILHNIE